MKMWGKDPERPWKMIPYIKRYDISNDRVKTLTSSFKNHKIGIVEKDGTVNIVDYREVLSDR